MTARLSVQLLAGLLCAPVVLLIAQEHPRPPQQSQSQQLPQTKTGAPQAATMEASMTDVSDGLKRFIGSYSMKSADKKFHMPYQRKDLACVDMRGTDGKIDEIDFFMVVRPGKLTVTETSVHKINGKPLYNWEEQ